MSGWNASDNAGHKQARKRWLKKWCETCHTTSRLQVHHRDRNPRNNEAYNCQTLCESCHRQTHLKAGDWGLGQVRPATCEICRAVFQPNRTRRAKICSKQECRAERGRRAAALRWGS